VRDWFNGRAVDSGLMLVPVGALLVLLILLLADGTFAP
jgi:hypothetical protein